MQPYLLSLLLICQNPPTRGDAQPADGPPAAEAQKRQEQIRQWQEIIGPVPVADNLFTALSLVPPQAENAFARLTEEKLSVNLVRDSLHWMQEIFRDPFNPCANMVAEGSLAPVPFDPDPRERRYDLQKPYLCRHRPGKYYLAPKDGLSLLAYEFDAGGYSLYILESSAGVLARVRPQGEAFNFAQGIQRQTLVSLIGNVLNLQHARKDKGIKPNPLNLPAVIDKPLAFHNLGDKPDENPQRDWSEQIHGCISKQGLFLVLVKSDIVSGGAASIRALGKPDSLWLRRELYLNDGKTLLINRKP